MDGWMGQWVPAGVLAVWAQFRSCTHTEAWVIRGLGGESGRSRSGSRLLSLPLCVRYPGFGDPWFGLAFSRGFPVPLTASSRLHIRSFPPYRTGLDEPVLRRMAAGRCAPTKIAAL